MLTFAIFGRKSFYYSEKINDAKIDRLCKGNILVDITWLTTKTYANVVMLKMLAERFYG